MQGYGQVLLLAVAHSPILLSKHALISVPFSAIQAKLLIMKRLLSVLPNARHIVLSLSSNHLAKAYKILPRCPILLYLVVNMSKPSHLRQLVNIISSAVDKIDDICAASGAQYPSLDDLSPSPITMDPSVVNQALLVVAACTQLSATVNIPAVELNGFGMSFHLSSSIGVALSGNVVEILRDAGENGMHISEIAKKTKMRAGVLGRMLRLLASHYVFREVSPNVFANNRLSAIMDTGKSLEEILKNPTDKHVETPGIGSLVELSADEMLKASAHIGEAMSKPECTLTPINLAFENDFFLFDWYEQPGNEFRMKRFNAAMEGMANQDPPDAILRGFQWCTLPPNSTIVDVGGGLGHLAMRIYREYPQYKYVVQDRPAFIEQTIEHWNRLHPQAVEDGTVKLQGIDFFTSQPITDASVFLIRSVIHNYPQERAIHILKVLREAAREDTKLLLIDIIAPYACVDPSSSTAIEGYCSDNAPEPLLANLGRASAMTYNLDLTMYMSINGEQRTLSAFIDLTESSGWHITEIFTIPGSIHKQILAVPI